MASQYEVTLAELEAEKNRVDGEITDLVSRNGGTGNIDSWPEGQITRMENLGRSSDRIKDKITALKADHVARMDEVEGAMRQPAEGASLESRYEAPYFTARQDPFAEVEKLRYDPEARRAPETDRDTVARAITALTDRKYRPQGVTDDHVENAVRLVESAPAVARYTLTHGSPAYQRAFDSYLRSQGQNVLLTQEETYAVRASLALGGSTGGYALPTLLDPSLIHTGTATRNPIRSIARVVQGTQNVWHGVSVGNVTTAWTAEGAALSDGSPTFSNPSVTAAKLTAYVTGSYEIFEDSDLLGQLPGLIGEAFDYAEGTAFIVGSGSNAPKGIVTAISGTAASTVTATTRGSFTSASAVDVFALVASLPSRYEASSTWVANKSYFNTIKQMSTGSQGSYFWTDFNAAVVPGAQPLLGSPVVQASDMATATTSGTVGMVLGDFSQFVVYDRVGTTVEFVSQVFNSSAQPLAQRGLIAHKRVGSDATDLNAFRFLKL